MGLGLGFGLVGPPIQIGGLAGRVRPTIRDDPVHVPEFLLAHTTRSLSAELAIATVPAQVPSWELPRRAVQLSPPKILDHCYSLLVKAGLNQFGANRGNKLSLP